MGRIILALLLCWLCSSQAHAKKHIWPFACVVHSADLIVVGEITAVRAHSVRLRIEGTVFGSCNDSVITVERWKEWTCDTRFAPYAQGQRLLMLLAKHNDRYAPINASTGELPVQQDSVSVPGNERFALGELTSAMRDVRTCFKTLVPYRPALSDRPSELVIEHICARAGTPDPPRQISARVWLYKESIPYCRNW